MLKFLENTEMSVILWWLTKCICRISLIQEYLIQMFARLELMFYQHSTLLIIIGQGKCQLTHQKLFNESCGRNYQVEKWQKMELQLKMSNSGKKMEISIIFSLGTLQWMQNFLSETSVFSESPLLFFCVDVNHNFFQAEKLYWS